MSTCTTGSAAPADHLATPDLPEVLSALLADLVSGMGFYPNTTILDPGHYVALVISVEFVNTQAAPVLRWSLKIRAGALKDRWFWLESPLASPEDLLRLLLTLEVVGLPRSLTDVADPGHWLGHLVGRTIFLKRNSVSDDTLVIVGVDEDAWPPNPFHPECDDYVVPERYQYYAL